MDKIPPKPSALYIDCGVVIGSVDMHLFMYGLSWHTIYMQCLVIPYRKDGLL